MAKGTRRPVRRTKINRRPKLLAFLMCERVDTGPDGVHSLVRLFDRSTFDAQIVLPPDAELPPIQAVHEFTVFARFGGGSGTFKHWLKMTNPSGKEHESLETEFWLRDPGKMHNVMSRMRIAVTEAGRYWISCFLDGEELARMAWDVEINVQRIAQT